MDSLCSVVVLQNIPLILSTIENLLGSSCKVPDIVARF